LGLSICCFEIITQLNQGVALQYILYSNLHPQLKRKSIVTLKFAPGQAQFVIVYTPKPNTDLSIKLPKIWSKVKCHFLVKIKSQGLFFEFNHFDRGQRFE